MTTDSQSVVVAGTGAIYRAPVGTPFPANISTAVSSAAWTDLGYTTEAGAKFSFDRQTTEVMAWQAYDPIRIVSTRIAKTVEVELREMNYHTWLTAMGGGAFAADGGGKWTYNPPAESAVDQFALIVEGVDGGKSYRLCFRKVMVSDAVEFAFVREDAVTLPLKFTVLAADSGATPFILQTNDTRLGDITIAAS